MWATNSREVVTTPESSVTHDSSAWVAIQTDPYHDHLFTITRTSLHLTVSSVGDGRMGPFQKQCTALVLDHSFIALAQWYSNEWKNNTPDKMRASPFWSLSTSTSSFVSVFYEPTLWHPRDYVCVCVPSSSAGTGGNTKKQHNNVKTYLRQGPNGLYRVNALQLDQPTNHDEDI